MILLVAMKVEFLTRWFSLSKLLYEKEMYETNSNHVETIELWSWKKKINRLKEKVESQ